MEKIKISTSSIQLDQAMKLCGVIHTGGEISFLEKEKKIYVNNELCTVRRKKLFPGDQIRVGKKKIFEIIRVEEEKDENQ